MKHIFVVSLLFYFMNQPYEILLVSDLRNILKENSLNRQDFDFCLKTNGCFVYTLKSGELIVIPNDTVHNTKGLLISNKENYQRCIDSDHFPIESEKKRIEEKYAEEIGSINKRADKIIEELKLKFIPSQNSKKIDRESLSELLLIVRENLKRLSEKDKVYSVLALGEYLREKNNGKWVLIKYYGAFNPYFQPAVVYPDSSVVTIWTSAGTYLRNSVMTPEDFSNLPYIKSPAGKLNRNFLNYKILE